MCLPEEFTTNMCVNLGNVHLTDVFKGIHSKHISCTTEMYLEHICLPGNLPLSDVFTKAVYL